MECLGSNRSNRIDKRVCVVCVSVSNELQVALTTEKIRLHVDKEKHYVEVCCFAATLNISM